eukprot:g4941.t1
MGTTRVSDRSPAPAGGGALPLFDAAKIGVLGNCAIGIMNLSLGKNSVTFYQLTKVSLVPGMVAFNFLVYGRTTPLNVCSSLLVITVGLVMATVTDTSISLFGFLTGCVAVVCTVLFQISMENAQKRHQVSGLDTQLAIAPWQFLCALVFFLCSAEPALLRGDGDATSTTQVSQQGEAAAQGFPFLTPDAMLERARSSLLLLQELPVAVVGGVQRLSTSVQTAARALLSDGDYELRSLTTDDYSRVELAFWWAASCASAQLTNYYCYTIIGIFSALTYQVVAHAKTILVLSGGMLFFQKQATWDVPHISGLVLTVMGIVWYSHIKMAATAAAAPATARITSKAQKERKKDL